MFGKKSTQGFSLQILGCGTSTGVPIPGCTCAVCNSSNPKNKRLRTSAVVKIGEKRILIDASIDLRQQALLWNLKRVDAVLYTHAHADHILGTDDLRCFNFVSKEHIPCYGDNKTLSDVKNYFDYIFNPDPDYVGGMLAQLNLHTINEFEPFELFGKTIQPFRLLHGAFEVMGYKFGDIAYATDCKIVPDRSREILRNNITHLFLDGLRYKAHGTHLTIPEAIEVAKDLGAKNTYLIHMTHDLDYEEVQASLPQGVNLAYDGLEVTGSW